MDPHPDRLPLVIGVTGHRDLRDQDVPALEAEVAGILATLRRDYLGGSAETPIIVLSALAEGADRLVARVALASGARLVAPLPLPVEEYRRDFEPGLKADNANEFDALLAQAIAAPVVPFTAGNSLAAVRTDMHKRDEQYRAVGLFIVEHCHILVALWDGDEQNSSPGGTSEVVKFMREGVPIDISRSARASLDGSEIGPVVHVVTPRMKQGTPAAAVAVAAWGQDVISAHYGGVVRRALATVGGFLGGLFLVETGKGRAPLTASVRRDLEAWENCALLASLTREFNREAAQLAASKHGMARVEQSFGYLFDDPQATASGDPDPKALARAEAPRWCRLYALTDVLAQDCQTDFKRDWLVMFMLAFAAFVCLATFSHLGAHSKLLLGAYSICIFVLFLVFWRARWRRHQERFLDYRALAEALRVAVYWRLIGIGSRRHAMTDATGGPDGAHAGTVAVLADAYPIGQPSELAWIKTSLRSLELLDHVEGTGREKDLDPRCHRVVRRCWVYGQWQFFLRRGASHNGLAEFLEDWAAVLLVVPALVLVPLLLLTAIGEAGKHSMLGVDLYGAFLVIIGLMPGVAAALAGYSERLALKGQARQYDRMRALFERGYGLLPEQIDERTASLVRALYRELGIEAMKENAEWVAIYRQRPIEPLQ
jgi:hypothetical protein